MKSAFHSAKVLIFLCCWDVCFLAFGQVPKEQVDLDDLFRQRLELKQEFSELVEKHRKSHPKVREKALSVLQAIHSRQISSLDQQIAQARLASDRKPPAVPQHRKVAFGSTPNEAEYNKIRGELRQSKWEAIFQARSLTANQRENAMVAWERENETKIQRERQLSEADMHARRSKLSTVDKNGDVWIPALPKDHLDLAQAEWKEIWTLRHQKRQLIVRLKNAAILLRERELERWDAKQGKRLRELEAELFRN